MTTKPKAGERMSDYLERCGGEMLRRAGASESEVADFADALSIQCNDPRKLTHSDASVWLTDWRNDRREQAIITREYRTRRIESGYTINAVPVDAPVYLNGVTAW